MYRLQHRVLHTGSANDPPRSRGPRITTQREDMYMMTSSHRHRFIPATNFWSVSDRLHGPEYLFIQTGTDSEPLGYELNDHTLVFPSRNTTESHAWIGCANTTVGLDVVIILFTHVTSWRPTTLTRSNGLPDHKICHL